MIGVLEELAPQIAAEGKRLHAQWDQARFDELTRGPAVSLRDALARQPDSTNAATLTAYLKLLREALGAGYLKHHQTLNSDGPIRSSFLEFGLLHLIPEFLHVEPPHARLDALAKIWNLGEGLLNGPAWMDRYVSAFTSELGRVGDAESFLLRVLGPALSPSEPASWEGPLQIAVLDARPAHDPFLPGDMVLAAPSVLCIRDRRAPDVHLGVLLRKGGQSRILGLFPHLDACDEDAPGPSVQCGEKRLQVGELAIDLPHVGHPHRILTAQAGFVVVSAADSQRLWIVEST